MALINPRNSVIACGRCHTAVITRDGKVACFGYNGNRECTVPVSLERAVSVSCGAYFTGVLTHEGKVVCWGWQNDGRCSAPSQLVNALALCCNYAHGAALTMQVKLCVGATTMKSNAMCLLRWGTLSL
jgi:alpha-tubulin suppressor-like RCC1 family protein